MQRPFLTTDTIAMCKGTYKVHLLVMHSRALKERIKQVSVAMVTSDPGQPMYCPLVNGHLSIYSDPDCPKFISSLYSN